MSDSTALFPSKYHRDAFYAQLKLMPIKEIRIQFQGGGDSGEIYSIEAIPTHEGNVVNITEVSLTWMNMQGQEVMMSLDKILEEIGYAALDMSDLDWYNNDGGQGDIIIHLDEDEPYISMNMEINYVTHEDHAFDSREGDLTEVAGE